LQDEHVRYLVVGGPAVVVHGYLRATADMELVIDMEQANVERALAAFGRLGFRPRAPVPLQAFADPAQRAAWSARRHMVVFSLFSPEHDTTEVDLFLTPPFDFGAAWTAARHEELAPGIKLPVVALDELLRMKREVGRDRDLLDVRELEELRDERRDQAR
ncbi:MAG TPA: hypothetical protein VK824_04445, partial [Planctomycetota bacterium]|nr:hypothetical protein [Planctomycetota bacterium]